MKKTFLVVLLISLMAMSLFNSSIMAADISGEVLIFHAGSLSIPFAEMEKAFEDKYPEVDVVREAAGSRTCARKITDLNRKADVMVSADYTVIDSLMIPDYTDWYLNFATNEMAIMFTEHSAYADEINSENWYKILLKDDVEYGHSDPNADPCGYRSQLVWKLAELHYNEENLYQKLSNGCPARNVRPKETDLLALLEAGELDYIFIYRSVAQQHGMPFITLSDKINLKTNEYSDFYAKAKFDVSGKKPGEKITKTGKPMVYGVTIPNNAPNKEGAVEFVRFLVGPEGQNIMEENGQPSIVPGVVNNINAVPDKIKEFVEEE
ncbi:MAG: tungstate ABC transporter substrate-binding protein WtpA [Bacillota bacterium]